MTRKSIQRSRDAKTQNQDKSGATQKQTHKEAIKATNEGIGTVNQTQENRESGSKRKKTWIHTPDTNIQMGIRRW